MNDLGRVQKICAMCDAIKAAAREEKKQNGGSVLCNDVLRSIECTMRGAFSEMREVLGPAAFDVLARGWPG